MTIPLNAIRLSALCLLLATASVVSSFSIPHQRTFAGSTTTSNTALNLRIDFTAADDSTTAPSFSEQVHVYNNVFSSDVCDDLHDLALDHADRSTDGSSVFYRYHKEHLTPLERALDSALVAMGDTTSTVVEYWSRHEYINIDVHADMDEEELSESGRILCPEWGHVLYLDVNIQGDGAPTVVFDQMGGWHDGGKKDIVTVPAVAGRVLRFPGSAMHAVPQPVNRWLLTDIEEDAIREKERFELSQNQNGEEEEDDDEEEYDDDDDEEYDDDDDEEIIERSVILFNTWGNSGPRGVQLDPVGGKIPDGIDIDEGVTDYIASQRKLQFEDWKDDYGGVGFPTLHCQPREAWVEEEICSSSSTEEEDNSPRVSLMGQKIRRLHGKKNVRFTVQGNLQQALNQDTQPVFLPGK